LTRKPPSVLPKNHPYSNVQQATFNNGFHEIRESTIIEENETFAMSNKASDMINAFAKKQEVEKQKKAVFDKGTRKRKESDQPKKVGRVLSLKRKEEDISGSGQDIGVIGNALRKTQQSTEESKKNSFGLVKKSPLPNPKQTRRGVQSNTNSAVKQKQQMPKKQTIDQSAEEGELKNKTLRFTNGNNFGVRDEDCWNKMTNGFSNFNQGPTHNDTDSQQSIEEDIVINNEMSPALTAAQKRKADRIIDSSGRPPKYKAPERPPPAAEEQMEPTIEEII